MKRLIQRGLFVMLGSSVSLFGLLGPVPVRAAQIPAPRLPIPAPTYSSAESQQLLNQLQAVQAAMNGFLQAEEDGYEWKAETLREQQDSGSNADTQNSIQQRLEQLRAAANQAETFRTNLEAQLEAAKDDLRRGDTESFADGLAALTLPPPPLPNGCTKQHLWVDEWRMRRDYLVQSIENTRSFLEQFPQTVFRPTGG